MLEEVLEALTLRPGMTVVDGTVGLAGHSRAIAERIAPGGTIHCFDWDEAMLSRAVKALKSSQGVTIVPHNADYREIPQRVGCEADAVFLDLGLNLAQITDPERGISFSADGPLDMRMDRSTGLPASHFVNSASASEIEQVLREFGGENWAKRIAEVIVDRRKKSRIDTTAQLVDCVMAAVPPPMRDKRIHPATRTFQAIRIHVNHELDDLDEAIKGAARSLAQGGRMTVLSYHSGEDRAVKTAFRSLAEEEGFSLIYKKPLVPSEDERRHNPKSRSAKLRVIERTPRKEKQKWA